MKLKFKHSFNFFLNQLIWPAVTGNIYWSLFTLLLDNKIEDSDSTFSRIFILATLSIYSIITILKPSNEKFHYEDSLFNEILDFIFANSILTLSIAIVYNSTYTDFFVVLVFIIAAIGHIFSIWSPKNIKKTGSLLIGILHLIFLNIFLALLFYYDVYMSSLIALSGDIILWFILRDLIYSKYIVDK